MFIYSENPTLFGFGPIYIIYGCRNESEQLYASELTKMEQFGIIKKKIVVFSREPQKQKVSKIRKKRNQFIQSFDPDVRSRRTETKQLVSLQAVN